MKRVLRIAVVIVLLTLLFGCEIIDNSYQIKYLKEDLATKEKAAYNYQALYEQQIEQNKTISKILDSFIIATDPGVANSILKDHKATYKLPDGTILGE